MKLLSLDQSSKMVGWSLFEDNKLISYGSKDFSTSGLLDERISKIKKWLNKLIIETKAEIFAIEEIQFQSNYLVYKVLAELLGVLANNFYEQELLYISVESSTWKGFCKIEGKQRKEQKENSIKFVKDFFGFNVNEDEADAINLGWYVVNNKKFM
jgi:Holliday junction resolvasome RuvABC endonuclease subunit